MGEFDGLEEGSATAALFEEYARMLDKEGDAEAAREARKIAQYSELR